MSKQRYTWTWYKNEFRDGVKEGSLFKCFEFKSVFRSFTWLEIKYMEENNLQNTEDYVKLRNGEWDIKYHFDRFSFSFLSGDYDWIVVYWTSYHKSVKFFVNKYSGR